MNEKARQLLIRTARIEDLDHIVAIEGVSFPTPWSERLLASEIKRRDCIVLAAESEGQLVGYVGMWYFAGQGHISTVAVHPGWRGQGVGEMLVLIVLLAAGERGAEFVELEYRVSNLPAESLYRKLGFETVGRRAQYYHDTGEDAILAAMDGLRTDEGRRALRERRESWGKERGLELVVDL